MGYYKGAAYGAVDYASGVADYASGVADYAGYGGAPDYDRGFDQGARYGAARYGEDIEEDYDEGYLGRGRLIAGPRGVSALFLGCCGGRCCRPGVLSLRVRTNARRCP